MTDEEFSFRDLIKPGEGAEVAIRKQVDNMARLEEMTPGQWYSGPGELLKSHGKPFKGRVLPDEYADVQGPAGKCHTNAIAACEMHPELRLFTGLYAVGTRITHHSWCIAPDGEVVEATYPTTAEPGSPTFDLNENDQVYKTGLGYQPPNMWAYFGLEFDASFMRAWHDQTGFLPLLELEKAAPTYISRKPFLKPYRKEGCAIPDDVEMETYRAAAKAELRAQYDLPDDFDFGDEEDNDEDVD